MVGIQIMYQSLQNSTYLWLAANEGMEKNMETTKKGFIGTTIMGYIGI